MNFIQKLSLSLPLLLIIFIVIAFCVDAFFDSRKGEQFYSLEIGQSEASVIQLMGNPDSKRTCPDYLWWDLDYKGKNHGECITEVRYEYFLSAWSIGYSSENKVVAKYRYVSE